MQIATTILPNVKQTAQIWADRMGETVNVYAVHNGSHQLLWYEAYPESWKENSWLRDMQKQTPVFSCQPKP